MTNLILTAINRLQNALDMVIARVVRDRVLSPDDSVAKVASLTHAQDQLTTAANHVLAAEFQSAMTEIVAASAKVEEFGKQVEAIVATMKDEASTASAVGTAVGVVGQALGIVAALV